MANYRQVDWILPVSHRPKHFARRGLQPKTSIYRIIIDKLQQLFRCFFSTFESALFCFFLDSEPEENLRAELEPWSKFMDQHEEDDLKVGNAVNFGFF